MFKANKTIGSYTIKDTKYLDYISLTTKISEEDINNLKYLNKKIGLNFKADPIVSFNEAKYFSDLINIFKRLSATKKSYHVIISVTNRKLLKDSHLLDNIPKNIDLSINDTDYEYTKSEYLKEEIILDSLVANIKEANLSPLEKYLAVYDIVKNYKPYKSNSNNSKDGTSLKEVLDKDNHYIVCAGYAKLLNDLLTRIDIPAKYISLSVDTRDNEDELVSLNKHARNLIKIDDNKYNIHGYYISDSTWDNSANENLYLNSLLTFDRKKEAKRLESLEDEDLLLDFHNKDEFNEKISYFIKRRISHPKVTFYIEEELRKKAYQSLYIKILEILKALDYSEYLNFLNKYKKLLFTDLYNTTSNEMEPIIRSILTDYQKYILPLSNNKINNESFLRAIINIRKHIYNESDAEIKAYLKKLIQGNSNRESIAFPYEFNPNNQTPAYLDDKPKTK